MKPRRRVTKTTCTRRRKSSLRSGPARCSSKAATALSALSPAQAGQGSGVVNACTFLGGSGGVAAGAIAFTLGGFVGVLMMIALAGIIGAALSRGISETP